MDVGGSVLLVGQHVEHTFLACGCHELLSRIQLLDSRIFRRTFRYINIANSSAASFGGKSRLVRSGVLPTTRWP